MVLWWPFWFCNPPPPVNFVVSRCIGQHKAHETFEQLCYSTLIKINNTVCHEPQCVRFRHIFTCSSVDKIHIIQCIVPDFVSSDLYAALPQ